MYIRQETNVYEGASAMAPWLESVGIEFGQWPMRDIPAELCKQAAQDKTCHADILKLIHPELHAVKEKHGYQSEDIVALTPQTPNIEGILAMFDKEHHHTDDEVRVVLAGSGIFGVVPQPKGQDEPVLPPFEIHVAAGDYINVPAYTRHWFTLTEEPFIVALRIFTTSAGWTAIYEPLPEEAAAV